MNFSIKLRNFNMKSQSIPFKIDTIIFDLDGTLHKTDTLSLPIFHGCIKKIYRQFNIEKPYPSDEIIKSQFGKQFKEICPIILKTNNPEINMSFANCLEKNAIKSLSEGKGELYPGVEKTLKILKNRGFKLAICTNSRYGYLNAIIKRFQFQKYFDLIMGLGNFPNKDKIWMVGEITKNLNTKQFVVVGDRIHDIEAAKANGGLTVGCAYGFAFEEIMEADYIISSFEELITILS